ncbi:MAG: CopG family transcriptional regulator [Phycisphaerae bacterium]|nr:MAG: CopG family transcriptional regulator [Phycisphaerae bacterium]
MPSIVRKGNPVRTVTLKIPVELYENLARLIAGTGFRSVTEFAIHVLRDVASNGSLDSAASDTPIEASKAVKDRLRSLGYID